MATVGVWKSASKYPGNKIWSVSARVVSVSSLALPVLAAIALLGSGLLFRELGFAPHRPSKPDMSTADVALEKMMEGMVAYEAPRTITLGDTSLVKAVLGVGVDVKEFIKIQKTSPLGQQIQSADILVSEIMEAELEGHAFKISPQGRQQQAVTYQENTVWEWMVTAIEPGAQKLSLRFFAVIKVAGSERPRRLITLNRTIKVEVTFSQRLKSFLSWVKDVHWLWTAMLLPIGLFSHKWWRKRHPAK